MVEKRTIAFIALTALVWALMASGFIGYYYMEQTKFENQLDEKQHLLDELAEDYETSTTKRNLLAGAYGTLFGEYQWYMGENYSSLMGKYGRLLSNLGDNYTLTLNVFPELNTTYGNLLGEFQQLNDKSQVSKEEFDLLLEDFYKLFVALTMKESDVSIGNVSAIEVSLCIDYGNSTIEWFNTSISSSASLFDLTQDAAAEVKYSYWQTMEPGHILITSINDYAKGYWVWYYWDEVSNDWVFGPMGCDAWILNNTGTYKWVCSS